jgi:hypothetical protein
MSSGPSWNFPARLLFSLPNINCGSLYVTMCTFGPNNHDAITLARSRVRLSSLPRDAPKMFSFPLMWARNGAQECARLFLCATLSPMAGTNGAKTYGGTPGSPVQFVPRNSV